MIGGVDRVLGGSKFSAENRNIRNIQKLNVSDVVKLARSISENKCLEDFKQKLVERE